MNLEAERSRHSTLRIATACVSVAALVYFSLSHTILELPGDANGRYTHFCVYALLMFFFAQMHVSRGSRVLIAVALVSLGIGLEVLQGYTGYRNFERGDMVANAAGVVVGWLAHHTLSFVTRVRETA